MPLRIEIFAPFISKIGTPVPSDACQLCSLFQLNRNKSFYGYNFPRKKKKGRACCITRGLSAVSRQPLFKSLMQDACSGTGGGRAGAYVCDVWRNGDPCAATFKQRFPQQPHAPLVPLSRLGNEAPPLPLSLMQPHAYAHTHTRAHTQASHLQRYLNLWFEKVLCKWYLSSSGLRCGSFDLSVWPRRGSPRHSEMSDSLHFNVKWGERPHVERHTSRPLGRRYQCHCYSWPPSATEPAAKHGNCLYSKFLNVIWIQSCLLWNVCN